MNKHSENLLAILLTLLLGLSPLQGAIAGLATSFDKEEDVHQLFDSQGHIVMDTGPVCHDSEHCNTNVGCDDHSCSYGQCATCMLAVLPVFSYPVNPVTTSELLRKDDRLVSA